MSTGKSYKFHGGVGEALTVINILKQMQVDSMSIAHYILLEEASSVIFKIMAMVGKQSSKVRLSRSEILVLHALQEAGYWLPLEFQKWVDKEASEIIAFYKSKNQKALWQLLSA